MPSSADGCAARSRQADPGQRLRAPGGLRLTDAPAHRPARPPARNPSGDSLATGEAERIAYSYDNSRLHALPDAVVFPTGHAQVEALVQACRAHKVPVTARGR